MFAQLMTDLAELKTEAELAQLLGCSQPNVNRIKRGKQKAVTHDLGERIKQLHLTLVSKSSIGPSPVAGSVAGECTDVAVPATR